MKPRAVEQAEKRFNRAKKAIQELKAASCYTDAESAWADFLLAYNGVYSKLEQGVKGNGPAEAWYGRKKSQRKKNNTLRYLHYARNSEEHGIERVTAEYGGFDPKKLKFGERVETTIRKVDPSTNENIGPECPVQIFGPCIMCVRVTDLRFGHYCDPPKFRKKNHLRVTMQGAKGEEYFDDSELPDLIAHDGLKLMEVIIQESKCYLQQ